MGLDADTVERVRTAGRIHDCGKLFCLDATRSRGGFNPIIKIHPEKGADMIRPFFGDDVAELVIGHHPKYFGSTYLESGPAQRAIIEADIWDALCEFRPYKASMSVNRATLILSMEGVQGSDLTWWRLTGDSILQALRQTYPWPSRSRPVKSSLPGYCAADRLDPEWVHDW